MVVIMTKSQLSFLYLFLMIFVIMAHISFTSARGGKIMTKFKNAKYAQASKPYSHVDFNEELPYVPRYRYPVGRYLGKRTQEDFDDTSKLSFRSKLIKLLQNLIQEEEYDDLY